MTTTKNINYRNIIDLSHPISLDMPIWPGDPAVAFNVVAKFESDGYYLRSLSIGEHSGTHINAPNSFYPQGQSIDHYPPSSLVAPVVVIDVREQTRNNNDYVISIADILAWEQQHGPIDAGSIVLFYTGWQAFWSNPQRFFNQDQEAQLHFPGVGGKATRFLLDERHIAGVGIDTHGVDPGFDHSYPTNHQVLAQAGIILENLNNLDQLPAKGATLVIGLLRIKGGTGSPVSVLAFSP